MYMKFFFQTNIIRVILKHVLALPRFITWGRTQMRIKTDYCNITSVMNLVATHYNCTSPLDYISHHALHTHIPVHHYTNHTAVTIHSLVLIVSPHLHLIHSHTFKQHSHMHSLLSLVFPWLTFPSVFPLCVYLCTTWTVDSLS